MNKYKYLAKNMVLFLMSGLFVNVVSFFLLPLYTYFLTTEEYAIIDLVTVTQQLLFPFLTLSLCDAVLRFAIESVEEKDKLGKVFSIGFSISIFSSVIVLFFSNILKVIFGTEFNIKYFVIIFILTTFNSFFSNFIRAINKVRVMAMVSGIGNILTIVLNVFFIVRLHWGLDGYMTAYIIGQIFILMGYILFGHIFLYVRLGSIDRNLLAKMLKYSVPLVPNALFWWINSSLDKYFLRTLMTFGVVGLYSVASKIPAIIVSINGIFQQAWNLSAFKEFNNKETGLFYNRIFQIYQFCLFVVSIALIASTHILAKLLFSKDFYEAWIFVPWLIWGAGINAMNAFWGSMFTAAKDTRILFTTTGMGAVVNIVLNYILIKGFGATGAAVATLVSYVVVWVVRERHIQKIVSINIDWRKYILIQGCILIQILFTLTEKTNAFLIGVIAEAIVVILYRKQLLQIIVNVRNGYRKVKIR